MPAQARISIMSLCQNNCNYEAVSTALRQSIGEQVRQVANFGVIAEDEHGESELEELTGNDIGCEVHDNWWDEDPLDEIDEFAQHVRSLAEFRDMDRRMRLARGYHPISRSPAFEPNRSKGNGRTKDSKQSLRYSWGKDIRDKNSSCRPWSSENRKGPPQREEGGTGRGTLLRRKHDDSMDIGGDDLATMGSWRSKRTTWWSTTSKQIFLVRSPAPNDTLPTSMRRRSVTK